MYLTREEKKLFRKIFYSAEAKVRKEKIENLNNERFENEVELAKGYLQVKKNEFKNLNVLKEYNLDSRYIADDQGGVFLIKAILIKEFIVKKMSPFINRDGYVEYVLTSKNGSKKHIQAQRIVAGLYLPKIPGKPYVNHKDLNRQNNSVDNLEWVSHSENLKHSYSTNPMRPRHNQHTYKK